MSKYVIKKDTSEVFLKSLDDGKFYFIGLTSKASTTTKVTQTLERAGIGNGVVAVINTAKDITIDVSTGLHYDSIAEMQNGTRFSTKAFTIPIELKGTLASNSFTLAGTDVPVGNVVVVEDINGIQYTGTFNAGTRVVTTTGLADGSIEIFYSVTQANTQVLDITKDNFPLNYEMWTHTISYDSKTNKLLTNIYRHYYKVMPDGNENDASEAGKNNGDSIKFTALLDDVQGTGKYGEYVIIPVATTSLATAPVLSAVSIVHSNPSVSTFTENATWRGAVTSVLVNSVVIPVANITLASGLLTLSSSLFPVAGIYSILVIATGYNTVTLNQTVS